MTQPVFECQNCEWTGPEEMLGSLPMQGIFERVAPGEPFPAGECPECGALCHERETA
jgi:predicted RNA-binding Zn-ribbon protein involved in translation (DUF1610 family)